MPSRNTIVTSAAAIVATAALAITGASLANANDTGTTSTAQAGSQDTAFGSTAPGAGGYGADGYGPGDGQAGHGPGGRGGHAHTEVTGADRTAVEQAVKAKDSGISVTQVLQDPDGSYDVIGTKADGSRVMVEVSKDLKTVEVRTGPPGGMGERGMRQGTPVAADVLTKIAAAVKAKDSTVTVHMGMKLTDGSYRAMGTKTDGTRVLVTLDKDLGVTDIATKPAGMGRHGGMRAEDGSGYGPATPGPSSPAPSTQATSTSFDAV